MCLEEGVGQTGGRSEHSPVEVRRRTQRHRGQTEKLGGFRMEASQI